ncbi:MAG: choline-sulfatase [Acidimicrobiales bacterium]
MRPNILLLMVDQLADAWLDDAITPAIDKLAAEGVRFSSTYSNSPLCAPARFAKMSGQLNSKIGAYDNAAEFGSRIPTFAHHLRAAGYQTSLVGKMHFVGADQLHGFEERLTTDIYPADFGWTPNWSDPGGRFDWWFHNLDSVINAGIAEASNQLDYDDEVAHQAVRKIRDLARTSDDRPWAMTVSFTHPHDPYVARQEFWNLYHHDAIVMPRTPTPAIPDPHSQRLAQVITADTTQPSDAHIRNARHAYLANVSYADALIQQILDTLEAHAMRDNTVVLFTSDHGDMLGERGLWYKMNFFEHSARIPLVLNFPSQIAPATVATNTSLLDIAPTLLELAGVEVPDTMDGQSLLSLGQRDGERTVLGEYLGEGAIAPILMIRRGDHKYVWSAADPPQLYDLSADPSELVNLALEPSPLALAFEAEIQHHWDPAALDAAVRADQQSRQIVDRALRQGRYQSWDYQPTTDAANQYMRNHLDLNEVESSRRS